MGYFNEQEEGNLLRSRHFLYILDQTRKWAKFLAILGFIGLGFQVLFALMALAGIGFFNALANDDAGGAGVIAGITYLVMAVLYYFPIKYLYDFSQRLSEVVRLQEEEHFRQAFFSLKAFFRFIGILTIIALGFIALSLVTFLTFGVTSAF